MPSTEQANARLLPHAAALCLLLAVILPLPNHLRSTGPLALRCDGASIAALFLSESACGAAAEDSACVCLPIAQSTGYTSLPLCLQIAAVMLASIGWTLKARGPRRLGWLNAAVVLAVLVDAAMLSMPGGWSLLILYYAPPVTLAACVVATASFLATVFVTSRVRRAGPRPPA